MSSYSFHPAVADWFDQSFDQPTPVQLQSWAAIASGKHTLLAAPTGSGKTLAAFMVSIDRLIREGLEQPLEQRTRVLYISPLKALSNDIQINLQYPIQGIRDKLLEHGLPDVPLQAWVRTGDTPAAERSRAIRNPPHILVTTPESIYILLSSESGRNMLSTVETVITDEIHAVAGGKRGSHLCLSLERLQALIEERRPGACLQRIGLSATQKPIEAMAQFMLGERASDCQIVDTGHRRERDLSLELPRSPLEAVMANEVWSEVYDRLHQLIEQHTTTLIFVNTRRLAERVAKNIAERVGETDVMAHHGSMSKEKRSTAERALKQGKLRCLVATASLELGIDIGEVDLVCQLGSPRSIAAFLQRVGRSGHSVNGTPKGRLFPLTRDELVETTALIGAANRGELDRIIIPQQPLDVLAQQIVAEVSGRDWVCDDLYRVMQQAGPYTSLSRKDFDDIIQMLGDGYSTRRGRRGAYLHYDAVNGRVRARRNARLVALTNGGAIPDQFDCDVILSPEDIRIGSVGEDFAFESMPGAIFQLGNTSYQILKVETGRMYVQDAHGQPPNLPFWVGEAPGRTDELSAAVSSLRQQFDETLQREGMSATQQWLVSSYQIPEIAAEQLTAYLGAAKAALGQLPTQQTIIFERFFDDVGDMHFVIHSCFGSRINRAWGLALRKRFCRKFNFELQAAALEDSIVLSLSSSHSFPLEEVAKYLNANTVREVLIQAFLDVPMFPTRWRWNATIALAVLRNRNGKRTPPYFQRSDAEDLVAILFPDQIACGENIAGDRQIPDHPLIKQTINDCLHETMDIIGLERLLTRLADGDLALRCCDLTAPSPLAEEIVNARPYAFLDEAPAEERRTLAVTARSSLNPADAAELGRLDQAAIDKVRDEAWPTVRDADELHDAMLVLGFILESETKRGSNTDESDAPWLPLFNKLLKEQRSCRVTLENSTVLWVCAERLQQVLAVFPAASRDPEISPVTNNDREDPLRELVRSRLEGLGPVTISQLAEPLGLSHTSIEIALLNLEQEGFVVQGRFSDAACNPEQEVEWCERRLLARIHRYTINRLRSEVEPVSLANYMRFLFDWQGLTDKGEGVEAVAGVLQQLEGYSAAAGAWESDILPARIALYTQDQLETLCVTGRFSWLRLHISNSTKQGRQKNPPVSQTPISLLQRHHIPDWRVFAKSCETGQLSSYAQTIAQLLDTKGALFFTDLVVQSGILRTQVEHALGELVSWGLVSSDGFAGLRALITPSSKLPRFGARRRGRDVGSPFDRAGRWSLIRPLNDLPEASQSIPDDALETLAYTLLQRYGVVFRRVLERETGLPPWRDLLRVYWRMEARGEIRGGRFVKRVSGEQFALPDAIGRLRKIRRSEKTGQLVVISATDPLNLTGTLLGGEKVSMGSNRHIVFKDGVPIAVQHKQEVSYLCEVDEQTRWDTSLLLSANPSHRNTAPLTSV